ncbi:hypothetical protein NPIL_27961 [Nephila pilipes]|uniref:Uncharacterized protein n=1 Tax=Nephila pilipes TaxID=299642 RepID=A0A8X6UB82_NEPPI|nr:hypothetical protein NPIL_27961 [Nephila pilipes]
MCVNDKSVTITIINNSNKTEDPSRSRCSEAGESFLVTSNWFGGYAAVPETSFVTYLSCQKKSLFPSEVSLDFVLWIPSAWGHHLRDIRRSLEIIEDKASFNVVSFILMDISCEAW